MRVETISHVQPATVPQSAIDRAAERIAYHLELANKTGKRDPNAWKTSLSDLAETLAELSPAPPIEPEPDPVTDPVITE